MERSAGWYEDPWGIARRRWWDGERWTSRVEEPLDAAEIAARAPERPHGSGRVATVARTRRHRRRRHDDRHPSVSGVPPQPPLEAARNRPVPASSLGIVVIAVALSISLAGVSPAVLPALAPSYAALLALHLVVVYLPLIGVIVAIRRTEGEHALATEAGWTFRPLDPLAGLLVAVCVFQATAIVDVLLSSATHLRGTNIGAIIEAQRDPSAAVVILVSGLLVAPVLEEVFFRGLLQARLAARLGTTPAVVIQALLFGAMHLGGTYGLHNVGLVLSVAAGGIVLGVSRQLTGRLGPGVAGHAIMNAIVILPILVR